MIYRFPVVSKLHAFLIIVSPVLCLVSLVREWPEKIQIACVLFMLFCDFGGYALVHIFRQNLIAKNRNKEITSKREDDLKDRLREKAWDELHNGIPDKTLYAKAYENAMGNKEKTNALYLKYRTEQLLLSEKNKYNE